jgi:adenine-specific DNA-methyltransferase
MDADGKITRAVNAQALATEIDSNVVSNPDECWLFTWPGKAEAIASANSPCDKLIVPCRDKSVDFDNTKNIYIEGDNLDALKILRTSYKGQVKMIYIDPPYNTGNDIVYHDSFNRHNVGKGSSWLSMMYPRLKLARDLLTEDGVIFISIGETEVAPLRIICEEIFGDSNFITDFIWKKKGVSTNVKNVMASTLTEHILCFSKTSVPCLNRRRTSPQTRKYPCHDDLGNYRTTIIEKKDAGDYARRTMKYEILGTKPREGKRWQIGEDKARELEKANRFVFDQGMVKLKIYDFEDSDTFSANPNLLLDYGSTESACKYLYTEIFKAQEVFPNPKPMELMRHLLNMGSNPDSIVLDFFSGSATTAHALLELNRIDGGHRRFITVQLPEPCGADTEAYKAGFMNISDLGLERLRIASKLLPTRNFDFGFRMFRMTSPSSDLNASELIWHIGSLLGFPLDVSIVLGVFDSTSYWAVDGGKAIICFEEASVNIASILEKYKPLWFVSQKGKNTDIIGIIADLHLETKVFSLPESLAWKS